MRSSSLAVPWMCTTLIWPASRRPSFRIAARTGFSATVSMLRDASIGMRSWFKRCANLEGAKTGRFSSVCRFQWLPAMQIAARFARTRTRNRQAAPLRLPVWLARRRAGDGGIEHGGISRCACGIHAACELEELLDPLQRRGRSTQDRPRELLGFGLQRRRCDPLGHEAESLRALCADALAGQDEVGHALVGRAIEQRPHHQRRRDVVVELGHLEDRILRRHGEVANGCERAADAERLALYDG